MSTSIRARGGIALFEEQPMRRAVETIFGGKLIDADVNSDFGLAAERFRNEFVKSRT